MFTVTFKSNETGEMVISASFGSERRAKKLARLLSETFSDVVVWIGQPGGMRA